MTRCGCAVVISGTHECQFTTDLFQVLDESLRPVSVGGEQIEAIVAVPGRVVDGFRIAGESIIQEAGGFEGLPEAVIDVGRIGVEPTLYRNIAIAASNSSRPRT